MEEGKINGLAATKLKAKLDSVRDLPPHPCIYRVPEFLRSTKEECYRPILVSIGPFFCKDGTLAAMKASKLRVLRYFLKRGNNSYTLEHYMNKIGELECQIRDCYAEEIGMESKDFIEMVLIDAVFIICILMRINGELDDKYEDLVDINSAQLFTKVSRDFFLEENQLPFFVLEHLCNMAFGNDFRGVASTYIRNGDSVLGDAIAEPEATDESINNAKEIMHLVDLLRHFCLPSSQRILICSSSVQGEDHDSNVEQNHNDNNGGRNHVPRSITRICCLPCCLGKKQHTNSSDGASIHFPPTVTKLTAAGVKVAISHSKRIIDVKFEEGVLHIPKFTVEDSTESVFRSIIFFEQCHYYPNTPFTDYTVFLDVLINTSADVEKLVEKRIIVNNLGSVEAVVNLFNSITDHITISGHFRYSDTSRRLQEHTDISYNRWKAILKRDYFDHPWSTISVIYAVILLILTVLQTINSFVTPNHNN